MTGAVRLVIFALALTIANASKVHTVGLRLGNRQAAASAAPKRALTYGDLAFLVSAESGTAQLTQPPSLEQAWTLLNLASDVLHKPRIVVIAFLPTRGQGSSKYIFDSSLSPFSIDGSHDCPNSDLDCIRKSLLNVFPDEQSDAVVIDSGVDFLEWVSTAERAETSMEEVVPLMKQAMDPNAQLLSLPGLNGLLEVSNGSLLSVKDEANFVVDGVTFLWDESCSKILMAEALALQQIRRTISSMSEKRMKTQILFLSPGRAFQCFSETGGADEKLKAVELLFFRLIELILDDVDRLTDSRLFGMIGLMEGEALKDSATDTESSDGFAVKEEVREAAANGQPMSEPSIKQMIQRRALQATEERKDYAPRKNIFWISVVLGFALVLAVLPILSLTDMNDPILSTKLFTTPVH